MAWTIPTNTDLVEVWDPYKVYRGALGGVEEYVKYQGGLWQSRYYSVGENPGLSAPDGSGAWFLAGRDANGDGKIDSLDNNAAPVDAPNYVPVLPDKVTGVEAIRSTDTTIAIGWDRAYVAGLGDVTSYNVYQDGVKIGSTTTTSFLIKGLDADTQYTIQVEAINLMVGTTNNNNTPGDPSDDFIRTPNRSDPVELHTNGEEVQSAKFYSPFMDMTLPSTNLAELATESGVKDFTLAFMQGLKSQIDGVGPNAQLKAGEAPTVGWGGITNTTLPEGVIIEQVRQVQKLGGEITISFGGYTGRDIAVLARQYGDQLDNNTADLMTAAEEAKAIKHLASQYQAVIDTYGVDHLDFDIENSTISGDDADKYQTVNDSVANHLRNMAVKKLQAENPGLHISYTVATTPGGLNDTIANSGRVLQMFKEAKADGVRIDVVNIMAMDYFSDTANIDMGLTAINAAKAVYKQLTDPTTQGGVGMTGVKIGITPMIGLNDYWNVADNKKEIFTLQDAQEVVDFAKETPWVAGLGAWQLTRDRAHSVDTTKDDAWNQEQNGAAPGSNYPNGQMPTPHQNDNVYAGPDPNHSDLQQAEWAFSDIFGKITKEATSNADIIAGGDEANNFRGLGGADRIFGNGGADTIDGGSGNDTMNGGADSDSYVVDGQGDVVIEGAGGGTQDRVASAATYALGSGVQVEILTTTNETSTTTLNLTGNEFAQLIVGNDGVNRIDGKAGADTMQGRGGNDTYVVDNGNDVIIEGAGGGTADAVYAVNIGYALGAAAQVELLATGDGSGTTALNLYGNNFGQTVMGNNGANLISGGGGIDTLRGLGGQDHFLFNAALGTTNVDTIFDFVVADDTIRIDDAIFTQAGPVNAALAAGAFTSNLTGAATALSHRIIYETDTGKLFYDADGLNGAAGVHFATLSGMPIGVAANDFLVV